MGLVASATTQNQEKMTLYSYSTRKDEGSQFEIYFLPNTYCCGIMMGNPTNETQCHHWLLHLLISYFQLVSIPSESPALSSSAPCFLPPLMPILTEGLMTLLHLTFCTDFLTDYTPFRTNVLSWSQGIYPITKVFAKFLELS